jgi:autophagy-related protein 13
MGAARVESERRINGCVGFNLRLGLTELMVQFNLVMPESDLHRSDLKLYQTISAYPSAAGLSTGIPPLLIAFILDVSDLPSGQALLWSRKNGKVSLDAGLGVQGKGKEKETRLGIVLERWTFRAT